MFSPIAKRGDVLERAQPEETFSPFSCVLETWNLPRHYASWLSRQEFPCPVESVGPSKDSCSNSARRPGPTSRISYSLKQGASARDYLDKRGLSKDTIEGFRAGT